MRPGTPAGKVWAPALATWLAMVSVLALAAPRAAWGLELCGPEARRLMAQAGIEEAKVERLCQLARVRAGAFAISIHRRENELGYCRLTLALQNNTADYLNTLALTSAGGRFEIFLFHNVFPGATGYASAKSRILIGCGEAVRDGLRFHWPASMRVGDRSPRGRGLERLKPLFTSDPLGWAVPGQPDEQR